MAPKDGVDKLTKPDPTPPALGPGNPAEGRRSLSLGAGWKSRWGQGAEAHPRPPARLLRRLVLLGLVLRLVGLGLLLGLGLGIRLGLGVGIRLGLRVGVSLGLGVGIRLLLGFGVGICLLLGL